jgi:F0F1-type ATP synthase assembly protein I
MLKLVTLWVCLCAYLNCAGWALSAIHQLNAGGYAAVLAVGLMALILWQRKTRAPIWPRIRWQRFRRRFRRLLPMIFLLVAALVFLGGALHPPNNYDALTYRLPRILNWFAAGKWEWISTVNQRMNYSAAGWEWVAAPLLLLLHSDRALFLINVVSFLLLPGLLFSVFRGLGVARRVAWTWMWALPLGYGYATQAGSIGNDLTGAWFCLASVHYGLRARRSGRVTDVWLAGLSAALMTAAKLSNLPLWLPCLIAVWPALPLLRARWLGSMAIAGGMALASVAPIVALNEFNTGCWHGDPHDADQLQVKSSGAALLGNSLLLCEQSFMPPALPVAHKADEWLKATLPHSWRLILSEKFPRFYLNHLNELPQEEAAGLGLGVTMLLLAVMVAAAVGFFRAEPKCSVSALMPMVVLGAWVAVLFYMLKMGSEATARLLLPYYPLAIVPILLLPVPSRLLRSRGWRMLIVLVSLGVLPAIIVSPARPLLPVVPLTGWLARNHPNNSTARRMATVYSAYAHRNDLLASLRAQLPGTVRAVGFAGDSDDSDYSLWRPFFFRRVEYLQDGSHPSLRLPSDTQWLVVKCAVWPGLTGESLDEWAGQHRARIVKSVSIETRVSEGEEAWSLLEIPNGN